MFFFFLFLSFSRFSPCRSQEISAEHSRIFGPGLNPATVVLPCRYFTVELRDPHNERLRSSPGVVFRTQILGTLWDQPSDRSFSLPHEILDRKDGSFLVRYKTHGSLRALSLQVTLGQGQEQKHVRGSPVRLNEDTGETRIQSSTCICPDSDFDAWFLRMGCPDSHPQIQDDLAPFPEIDMVSALKEATSRFQRRQSYSFCHYVVKGNKIHRQCFGEHVGFNMFVDHTLLFLTRLVRLPDVEFLINLGDWPLVKKNREPLIPMISWCKDDTTADVLLPTYDLTEASIECMGRQMLDMLSIQRNSGVDWDSKEAKAFFRGRDSRQERLDLVRFSMNHTDLIDAGLTNYFFFREQEEKLGKSEHISFFDFFKYKYQLTVDGTVAAYRLPYLLAGGSLVFKQDSKYVEHFYGQLQAGKHYIPFKTDLGDLIDKIQWAKENDAAAREIAENARIFAEENLMPKEIVCYHALLFREWNKRLKIRPFVIDKEMTEVKQEWKMHKQHNCHCKKSKGKLKKEEL